MEACCGSCKYNSYNSEIEEFFCKNKDSDSYGMLTLGDDYCEDYEAEEWRLINKVILIGRTTGEPKITYLQNEKSTAVARFALAVHRKFKKSGGAEAGADFINCTAFGKTAETLEKYVPKGAKICAEGEWRTGNYINRDGQKVYTNDCHISSFEFCESKNASQNNQAQQAQAGWLPPMPSGTSQDGFMSIPEGIDEELPFA